jgi:hypothetical protein
MENKLIKNIVGQFKDIQEQELWLDENFKKKIDSLSEELAFERPLTDLHSVAELISHILVWRKESILKLKGLKSTLTMESPENWLTNEVLEKKGWENLKSEFYQSQKDIIELIENKTDEYLEKEYTDGFKFKYLLEGLIHHDLYHLGQIGIVIKLLNKNVIEKREQVIHNYVEGYNTFDISKMIKDFSENVIFKHLQDGQVTLTLNGIEEFTNQAETAKEFFLQRKQEILNFKHLRDKTEIEIDYQGVLSQDFPIGLKKGHEIKLKGKSTFEFRNGKIMGLTDES